MTASELLAAGLRRGAEGITFENARVVRSLVLSLKAIAPRQPEINDFEERYEREPFFGAQATLRGMTVELCILLMFWLSKDASTPIGAASRQALSNLPDVKGALEDELADLSPTGRIPRAIMGRYLNHLFYFGEDWLRSHLSALLPANDTSLRQASWHTHLWHDQGPNKDLMPEMRKWYAEEIARLSSTDEQPDRNFHQDRLVDYIIVLYLWDGLPEDLLEQFWQTAPAHLRRHAMWFLGTQLASPASELPDATRARGFAYWERRLETARHARDPDAFREELGAIGQWTLRDEIDDGWLSDQLLSMLKAGFAPKDAFSVIDWLAKTLPANVDRAVEILALLLANPRLDQWAYMTQREPIRAVLSQGLTSGSPETVSRVHGTVSFLSSIGETSYLDLVRASPAE
jgi:hypothetical protein